MKVWVAISATNTKERVQTVGPFDLVARTTITVDPADDNRFLSATPWQYTAPAIPALDWTALGGDVVFGQDAGGNMAQLPVGPSGALRAVAGSAVIHISFPAGGAIYMDCRPGATDVEFDFSGPTYQPRPVSPFDTEAGPRNTACLNSVGRSVAGSPANFPDGLDREIDPMRIGLSTSGAAAKYTVGSPYTLPATSLNAVLSADTLATLRSVGGLVVADKTYPVEAWVTIAASNTTEGVRTVRAAATYTPTAGLGPVVLPETTWTPTGAGPIRFTLAGPGLVVGRRERHCPTAASSSRSAPRALPRRWTARRPRSRSPTTRSRGRTRAAPAPRAATRSRPTRRAPCSRARSTASSRP